MSNNKIIKLKDGNKSADIFKYIIHRTFHRPRDLVQFCIKIQDEVKKSNEFYYRTILNAEKEYSLWLLSEVENEIGVVISEVDTMYEFLRSLGSKPLTLNTFKSKFKKYENKLNIDAEKLAKYLYSIGLIFNVNEGMNYTEYFSIIRNDKSTLNRDLKIQLHSGFWKGLHTSTYATFV